MATAKQLITRIEAGEFDGVFGRLYAHDAAVIETQRKRYIQTIQEFEECFGEGRDLRIYSAPGRTELGGNHTDHNNGVVMSSIFAREDSRSYAKPIVNGTSTYAMTKEEEEALQQAMSK